MYNIWQIPVAVECPNGIPLVTPLTFSEFQSTVHRKKFLSNKQEHWWCKIDFYFLEFPFQIP
jgi:hypothetical protein